MHHKPVAVPILCLLLSSAAFAAERDAAKSPWSTELEIGIGYDSNAYLAPDTAYIDYAQTPPTLVRPVEHSGTFIPVSVDFDYDGRGGGKYGLIGSYSFDGDFYPESETKNANEYNHKLIAGVEFLLNQSGRHEDTFSLTPYYGVHDKTYFNRDTGDQMTSNLGTDLSDRYSYNIIGLRAELKRDTPTIPYSLHAEIARRDYTEPSSTAFDSYDHDYLRIGGDMEFSVATPTKLLLSYDYFTRDFDEWRPRDLSGDYVSGITREYVYNRFGASIRQRINSDFILYLDYDLTDRSDEYVGYRDYTKNSYGLRVIYSKDRLRLRAKAVWWDRDYDNAFAFDEPTQEDMSYESTEYSIKGDYDLNRHHGLWAELISVDQKSTDMRYEYDRVQIMAGWRWGS